MSSDRIVNRQVETIDVLPDNRLRIDLGEGHYQSRVSGGAASPIATRLRTMSALRRNLCR